MTDIILINPPLDIADGRLVRNNQFSLPQTPLGLLWIGAVLEKNNYSVRVIDLLVEKIKKPILFV